ncbi:MAG: ribonuclease R [Bacteroidales bacterium]|nr:ribonuclease R [Bacteroidales bacterium]
MKPQRRGRKTVQQRRKRKAGKTVFPQFVGKVQMTREGYVFVIIDGEDDDVFVRAAKTRGALNGDTVRVAVTRTPHSGGRAKALIGQAARGERREGEIVEIIKRSEKPFVGVFHMVGAHAWVLMQSRFMPYDIEVDGEQALEMGAQTGFKVAALVEGWNRGENCPYGRVVDVLGAPGANETEMHAILAEFNLPYRFEKFVEDAAEKIPSEITPADLAERRDFRQVFTFTIDPADAKDYDDALSFRPLENGNYEVGVHIADVSHYVLPGSPVDKEAQDRGTSVYLVDRTVPMLPEKLCNRLCSLRPHEDKLTFSAVFELTADVKVRKKWFGRTVINSDFRLDYNQAQEVIKAEPDQPAGESFGCTAELRTALQTLNFMALILKDRRQKAGAIDFDRPEMKVKCDETGKPIEIYQVHSFEANWLIEEFMLLANRSVAEFVSGKGKTFVYRVHDTPNEEKLAGLRTFAKSMGYKMDSDLEGRGSARAVNDLLTRSEGRPEGEAFRDIALRAMAKAKYSVDNIGHYGLAFADYTHFTSPIRRYPDLMVHRLLSIYLANGKSQDKDYYAAQCDHASEREAIATDAERTSIKYKLVEYMQDHIGEEFDGHISGITEWGMYVEIEPTHIEGMVPLREIKGDFYEFEEDKYRLRGRRTRRIFRLGDPVRIRVSSANLEQRLLDFELLDKEE